MQGKRIETLDFFRAVSAIFVVLYHYTTRYNMSYGHTKAPYYLNFEFGCMFVSMFFILSGFLIVKNIEKEKNIFKFIIGRIIRLWPTFVAAMSITSIILFAGGQAFADKVPTIEQFILNLTMFPSYIGSKPIDGAYWTMAVEILFYIIISLTILINKKEKIKIICLLWSAISLIVNILSFVTNNIIIKALKILLITEYAQLFITGMLLYLFYKEKKYKDYFLYICLVLCVINQFLSLGWEYTIFYIIETIMFFVIVILNLVKIPNWLNNKVIKFIATISYPLYLLHQMIGYVIINKLEQLGLNNELYILVPFGLMVILAYLLNKFVEVPVIRWYKNKSLKVEQKQIKVTVNKGEGESV